MAPGIKVAGISGLAVLRSGPLGVPAFRLLSAGQFTSTIGDYCYAVVLPWLVLAHHSSAGSLGVVLACYGLPRALLTVPGGALADRFGPLRVMIVSDALRCALTSVFTVLAATSGSSLAAIAPVSAALGACSALFLPASLTLMPSLIEDAKLTSANALYTGSLQTGSILGPVIGGILVAMASPAPAFAVDAASYLVSATCLLLIGHASARPEPARPPARAAAAPEPTATAEAMTAKAATAMIAGAMPAEAATADAVAAQEAPEAPPGGAPESAATSVWALLRRERLLRIILLVSFSANFALTGTTEVTLPALAHARYGAAGFGVVLGCIAVMGVLGALIVARLGERFVRATLIAGAFQVAAVAIAAAPFFGGLAGLAVGLSVFGLALGFDNAVWGTLIQRWAPPELLGRVWGVLMLAPVCSFPLSTLTAGLLTRHLGPTPVFPIAGALLALSYLYGLSSREFRELGRPRAPLRSGESRSLSRTYRGDSGPARSAAGRKREVRRTPAAD